MQTFYGIFSLTQLSLSPTEFPSHGYSHTP